MKKYFLCMVALLSLAIVACESDDTAPAPTVRPTFDLIDAQPDVTSAVVAANIESKGEVPILRSRLLLPGKRAESTSMWFVRISRTVWPGRP